MVSHDGRVLTGTDLRFVDRADLGRREDGSRATPAAGFERVRGNDEPTSLPHIAAAR
jgi:hypothetical protein